MGISNKRHLGSLLVIIIGFSGFGNGVNTVAEALPYKLNGIIWGPALILQGLAFRSAKKRKYLEVRDTKIRRFFEVLSVVASLLAMLMLNNLTFWLANDPIPFFLVGTGSIFCFYMIFSKPVRNS